MQQLSQSLAENLSALDARFGKSADYYAKKIVLYGCPGCIVMFDGMASLDSLWELLLDAAGRQSASVRLTGTQAYAHILHGSAFPAESTPVQDMSQLVARLTAGMAVLLLEGCSSGIVFSVQGLKFRSVEEPSAEGNLRGSREGFTDLLRVNLSLLRRLVRTDTLMQEAAQAHTCCNTEYALCYCKDRADPAMVQRVRAILQSARPELLLDSSYFVPWLLPGKARLFTPVHYTERPAVAAAKLCEGKLVILVNGSPSALVLPALFSEQFECLDDYASTAVFSSFLRVLKYFSFYLTVFLPGVFVCVAVHLPELLPPQLLYKIEAAEKATPLPLFAEMLLVILLLEIIREAGLRMPQSLGHSVSLVSALIIGDAAIATGLMSTPVIFVASITAIAVFVTPGLYEPATLLRIGTVLLAGLAGPVGLAAAFFGFCSASSAPKHWACRILRRTPSRSSRFPRTAFCAATTGSCPGRGSISGKSGRGGNGGHEAANRTFYPGGVDPQFGNCSAGRRHPAKRSGAPGAVAGRGQRGVPVHPFGAGSGNVAEQSALPCGAAGTDSWAFYGTDAHPRAGTRAVHGRVFLHGAAGLSAAAALGGVGCPSCKLERFGAGAVVVCRCGRRGLPVGACRAAALVPAVYPGTADCSKLGHTGLR